MEECVKSKLKKKTSVQIKEVIIFIQFFEIDPQITNNKKRKKINKGHEGPL